MLIPAVLSTLALTQPQPGSVADMAERPLWRIAEQGRTLAAVDRAPAVATPSGPVDITFWLYLEDNSGYDSMASAITVDCATRTFAHRSFAGFRGQDFLGSAEALDTSSTTAEPDTYYGAMLSHVCDPSPDRERPADYENFRAIGASRAARPPA